MYTAPMESKEKRDTQFDGDDDYDNDNTSEENKDEDVKRFEKLNAVLQLHRSDAQNDELDYSDSIDATPADEGGIILEVDDNANMSGENKEIPEGKLYSNVYEYINDWSHESLNMLPDEDRISHINLQVKMQTGYNTQLDVPLDESWNRENRTFIPFSSYEDKYPEMSRIDTAQWWVVSYEKMWNQSWPFDDTSNKILAGGILTFDSFIRAKLNRDIPSEQKIKNNIDNLYK